MKLLTRYNPFIPNKATDSVNSKYLFIIVIILFFVLRLPLLESHFYHCDDNSRLLTYPLLTNCIGYLNWWISEILHYKVFKTIPAFVFENILSRAFSLIMSFVSLWTLLLITKKMFSNNYITFIVGVIYSCSQMSIIYSINSGPYGYGVLPINLMILYLLCSNNKLTILLFSVMLAPYISIFSIFLIPAFSFSLIVKNYFNTRRFIDTNKIDLLTLLLLFINSLVVIVFQIIPMKEKITERALALNWNKGIDNQFLFENNSFLNIIYNPLETIWFYFKNLMLILENNLSPINALNGISQNTIAIAIGLVFFPIIYFGFRNLREINKEVSLFMIVSISSVFLLVYFNFLTLSPTRHYLWVNCFVLILISSILFIHKNNVVIIIISVGFFLLTGLSYFSFFTSREGKITYSSLKVLEEKYKVDFFIDYTINSKDWFTTSQNVSTLYRDKNLRSFKDGIYKDISPLVFCLVSNRPIDNLKNEELIRRKTSIYTVLINNKIEKTVKNSKTLYENYIFSNTEVGRSKFCSNGTNGLFMKIIKVDFK
tara:strand:+ start:5125 stop:6747 length:1623 start_codon:yes stop_codon:yes gene_type:complete